MANKASGCFKRLAIGCGVVAALFVLVGALAAISLVINKPSDPDFTEIKDGASFEVNPENALNLPAGERQAKPVRLVIDASMGRFQVKPGSERGKINIEAKYDQGNFELLTESREKDDYIEYKVTFKSKISMLGMIINSRNDDFDPGDNNVTLYLPPDLVFDIKSKTDIGEFDFNLSGLAVNSLDLRTSKGETDIKMPEPNQIPMQSMKIDSSMGELKVTDYQNMRFTKGRIEGSMGEMEVSNSGSLEKDIDLHVKMTMGAARVYVPNNARIDGSAGAFMGESRMTNSEPEGDDPPFNMKVSGGATMGEFRVLRGESQSARFSNYRKRLDFENIDVLVNEFKAIHEENPKSRLVAQSEIRALGRYLIRNGKATEGIEVLKLNVDFYPDNVFSYYRLANAYYDLGEDELALANYRIVVEMDPENSPNSRKQIAKLERRLERSSPASETEAIATAEEAPKDDADN